MYRYLFLLILLETVMGCRDKHLDKQSIEVKACVIDSVDGRPIAQARLVILCWYNAGWGKTDYVSIDTTTDKDGCISTKFDEGYKVVVAGIGSKYSVGLTELSEVDKDQMNVILKLKARTLPDTTSSYLKFNLRDYIVQQTANQ